MYNARLLDLPSADHTLRFFSLSVQVHARFHVEEPAEWDTGYDKKYVPKYNMYMRTSRQMRVFQYQQRLISLVVVQD